MNISTYIYAVTGIILFMIGYFVYGIYKDNQILKQNEVLYEQSIKQQSEKITELENSIKQKDEINEKLNIISEKAIQDTSVLEEKFRKEKTVTVEIDGKETEITKQRDLNELSNAKPKLVQKAINKGTITAFKCIETVTDPSVDISTLTLEECK